MINALGRIKNIKNRLIIKNKRRRLKNLYIYVMTGLTGGVQLRPIIGSVVSHFEVNFQQKIEPINILQERQSNITYQAFLKLGSIYSIFII